MDAGLKARSTIPRSWPPEFWQKRRDRRGASPSAASASNIQTSMLGITVRRKARQFGTLIRHSAMTPRTGITRKPVLARRGQLGVTFIGHSSFFLQIGGKNILVDPNFARWIFVLKRLRRPGLRLGDLPPIDAVLVSHAHFDHLHRPSLRAIARLSRRKSGKRPAIIVPRNVRDIVSDLGYGPIVELEWWQSFQLGNVEITHVPSRHWGARMVRDMHRGFGGFVLRAGQHSLYHAGDTAYLKASARSASGCGPRLRCYPLGLIIRIRFAEYIPARKTRCRHSSTWERAGWCPCITGRSVFPTSRWTSRLSG